MIHELSKHHSVFNQFVREIRDEEIQKDRMRFRRNLSRMGEVMAYEISKTFDYKSELVTTPLGEATVEIMDEQPVICAIMRAALPMHEGFLNYFDQADNAFAAAYRRHHKGGDWEIEVDYLSSPTLEGRVLIIVDPMLATGSSIEMVYKKLVGRGHPKRIHLAAAIAAEAGVNHVRSKLPENTMIWVGALDKELTAQSYIVPGLGDAGDLAFGRKD
ncbi:MAG: uracil phosphoribosyltransferase [Crocinitomicaceae bacterium]|nr:uracil phosphoribosyltransferase [Crocinitomicaceae bacterium]